MLNSLASAAGLARPKKKFHFDVSFTLEKLLNCTYVAGLIFSKIRLVDGGNYNTYKFTDQSKSCDVNGHTVNWGQEFEFHCKMYASPLTGELEPCCCKVSIRKETKGGRSYKKLGYVKINLAEYAGAGAVQRKYLLESYNEHKHKPDNSILTVTICLRQTSGDSVFRAPRAVDPMGELGGDSPEDEGIQPDLHSLPRHSYTSSSRVSATSSALSFYSPVSPSVTMDTTNPSPTADMLSLDTTVTSSKDEGSREEGGIVGGPNGGDDQGGTGSSCAEGTEVGVAGLSGGETGGLRVAGVRRQEAVTERSQTSGASRGGGGASRGGGGASRGGGGGGGSLQDIRLALNKETRKTNSAMNLRETGSIDLKDLSVVQEGVNEATPTNHSPSSRSSKGPSSSSDKLTTRTGSFDSTSPSDNSIHSHTIGGTRFPLPPVGGPTHRRLSSWSQASNTRSPNSMHKRQQSTASGQGVASGQSSKSTSAYSTLSERSTASSIVEGAGQGAEGAGDDPSGSLRGKHGRLSSRVEQSRVDSQAVVDNLFSSLNFSRSEADINGDRDRDQGGLKIYVDKNRGTITLAASSLDKRGGNLQAIDVDKHSSQSPRRRRSKKDSRLATEQTSSATPREMSPPTQPINTSVPLAPPTQAPPDQPASLPSQGGSNIQDALEPPVARARANSASSSSDSTKTLTPIR